MGRAACRGTTAGSALLLAAAILAGGAHGAKAGTLAFTFTDDGSTSTITPSGSLDLSSLKYQEGNRLVSTSISINLQGNSPLLAIHTSEAGAKRRLYTKFDNTITVSFSGGASYAGNSHTSDFASYYSGFSVSLNNDGLAVDPENISGNSFAPTRSATFGGTLLSVLGDDDFHIEGTINGERIIFTTVRSLPAEPELTATLGDGQVTLKWTDPGDISITRYEIQQKTGGGDYGVWAPINGSDASTTSHTVGGLKVETEYAFRIRAVNFLGTSTSAEIMVTPVLEDTPAAAELTATAGTERAELSWTHAGDTSITKWQYQQREGEEDFGTEWKDIPGSDASVRRHTLYGLTGDIVHGFRVRAVNKVGIGTPSNEARVVPPGLSAEREQQVAKQSLAAVGQATLAGATDIIDGRLQATPRGNGLMLGGQLVDTAASSRGSPVGRETGGWWSGNRASEAFHRPVDDAGMLNGSAFNLSLNGEDPGDSNSGWTIWGRGDYRSFEGKSGEDSWNGSVKSAWLGLDTQTGDRMLAGIAVSRNRGGFDLVTDEVGSRVETTMIAAWPYMQMTMPTGTGTVRVVVGVGSGHATHHSDGSEVERAGLSMTAASVGGRWAMGQRGQVTLSVPIKVDVVQFNTDGDATTAIGGISVRTWQAIGGVEATHSGVALTDSGWILTPRGSLSLRWDGGDGVTGKGIEVGGGFGLHAPDSRLSLDASGRWLATHSDSDQKEWGASIGLQIAPDSEGRGWSASLRQEWGLQQEGALSSDTLFEGGTGGSPSAPGSLAARAGYGFGLMEGLMTLSADARLTTGEEEVPHYGAGMEFALPGGLSASVRGEHVDAIDPDTRIGAGLNLRF